MEKTKEEVRTIIVEELTTQMIEDGKRVGAPQNIITQAVSAASLSLNSTANRIVEKLYN